MPSRFDRPERLQFAREQRKHFRKTNRRMVWIKKTFPYLYWRVWKRVPKWVSIGKNVTIHKNVQFTEGFGYARNEKGHWIHIPHTGGVILGDRVEIYEGTTVNRATVDTTSIGAGTKIDHHCHIGHNSETGKDCIICAGVIISGGASIGNNVWIGPNTSILNKIKVGENVYIGQGSNVVKSIPMNYLISGNPAKVMRDHDMPHNKIG